MVLTSEPLATDARIATSPDRVIRRDDESVVPSALSAGVALPYAAPSRRVGMLLPVTWKARVTSAPGLALNVTVREVRIFSPPDATREMPTTTVPPGRNSSRPA